MPGDHLLRNSISYGNLANGVTSNSGPNPQLENVTTVYNGHVLPDTSGAGVNLYTNAESTDYRASGVVSFANDILDSFDLRDQDESFLHDSSNYFNGQLSSEAEAGQRPAQVSEDWFVATDYEEIRPEIATDGSVDMSGLFELTDAAPEDTGARMSPNSNPTELEVLPAVTSSEPDNGDDADSDADAGADPERGAEDFEDGRAEASGSADGDEAPAASGPPGLAATGASLLLPLMLVIGLLTFGGLLMARFREQRVR